MKQITTKANTIIKNAKKQKTDADKALYVMDYLRENVFINWETVTLPYFAGALSGPLTSRRECSCGGFAHATKYILNQLNIPCIIVLGKQNEYDANHHAWNYVKIGEKWYLLDVGFNRRLIGKKDVEEWEYKLSSDNLMGTTYVQVRFKVPTLSEISYH